MCVCVCVCVGGGRAHRGGGSRKGQAEEQRQRADFLSGQDVGQRQAAVAAAVARMNRLEDVGQLQEVEADHGGGQDGELRRRHSRGLAPPPKTPQPCSFTINVGPQHLVGKLENTLRNKLLSQDEGGGFQIKSTTDVAIVISAHQLTYLFLVSIAVSFSFSTCVCVCRQVNKHFRSLLH